MSTTLNPITQVNKMRPLKNRCGILPAGGLGVDQDYFSSLKIEIHAYG
jgi:hypothetical protein